jgi:hypothetical protein
MNLWNTRLCLLSKNASVTNGGFGRKGNRHTGGIARAREVIDCTIVCMTKAMVPGLEGWEALQQEGMICRELPTTKGI